jgi:7,8-dihydropterin-6-yl-methyl-4-(beta-D-ribofuranosyl)aminobenzene 5'-phosphate synthase
VVSVLKHAQSCFPSVTLCALTGGFHLSGDNEKIIPKMSVALEALGFKLIAPAIASGAPSTRL